jgi:hypothetical protein
VCVVWEGASWPWAAGTSSLAPGVSSLPWHVVAGMPWVVALQVVPLVAPDSYTAAFLEGAFAWVGRLHHGCIRWDIRVGDGVDHRRWA